MSNSPFTEVNLTELDFSSLEPIALPVTLPGRKKGDPPRKCVLREASEEIAAKFNSAVTRAVRMADGKMIGMDGIGEAEAILVQGCLFEVVPGPSGTGPETERPFVIGEVRALPHRIVRPLFERAKDISQLGGGDDTEDSLTKEIAKLQTKLDGIRAAKVDSDSAGSGGESLPKEPSPSTAGTSD